MAQRINTSYTEYDQTEGDYLVGLLSPLVLPDDHDVQITLNFTVGDDCEMKQKVISSEALMVCDTGIGFTFHPVDLNVPTVEGQYVHVHFIEVGV